MADGRPAGLHSPSGSTHDWSADYGHDGGWGEQHYETEERYGYAERPAEFHHEEQEAPPPSEQFGAAGEELPPSTEHDQPTELALPAAVDHIQLEESSPPPALRAENGQASASSLTHGHADLNMLSTDELREELARVREERDGLEEQYKGLLGKLTQMRITLGQRLQTDAEELDRREQQIEALSASNAELTSAVDTLRTELVASHEEAERMAKEMDSLRAAAEAAAAAAASSTAHTSPAAHSQASNALELQETVERLRVEAEGWESACAEERAAKEDAEQALRIEASRREDAEQREAEWRDTAQRESETARGLQSVLEEFQAAQDSELQRALGDFQDKYERVAGDLEANQARATQAESQLENFRDAAGRCAGLEQEVKEKSLLIGKLRHEAVILNEHLTEALKRLRDNRADSMVDRNLVTNLFLKFLTTPRADAKRFEMLNLISSVLQWDDDERESAGLQRIGGPSTPGGGGGVAGGLLRKVGIGASSRSSPKPSHGRPGHGRSKAVDGTAGDESFSNLFVEFLLAEASQKEGLPSTEELTDASELQQGNHLSPSAGGPLSPGLRSLEAAPFNLHSLANLEQQRSSGAGLSPSSATS